MSNNNSRKSVLVICPQGQYGYLRRIQLSVSAQWCQTLYVSGQGMMVYKGMHKIVFQLN